MRRKDYFRLFGTILAVGLLIYLLAQQGWGDIATAFRQISWWRLALALGLTLISRFAVAARWHALLRGTGVTISYGQTARITFAGFFGNNFLPTTIGGDVIRLGGALRLGFDRAISLASLVVDRLVGMAGMAMALPFVIPAFFGKTLRVSETLSVCSFLSFGKSLWDRILHLLHRLLEALSLWLKKPRSLLLALAFTWIHMACTFGSVWLILGGMGQNISFGLIGGLWSMGYFITLLPVSINGMGIQELSITGLYTHFGGVSTESGLILALLMRVLPMFASLPGALFVPEMLTGVKNQPQKV
jgi:uncharacterized membrane protein YbhN (UPF0104 family)